MSTFIIPIKAKLKINATSEAEAREIAALALVGIEDEMEDKLGSQLDWELGRSGRDRA